jgi:hypothetical protein
MACEILVGYSIDIFEEIEVDDETRSHCSRVGEVVPLVTMRHHSLDW